MNFKKWWITLVSVTVLSYAASAQAALISIADVTASSTWFTYDRINLINGNGLSGASHSGDFTTKWMTDSTTTGWLVFDLGGTYSLTNTNIWNYGNGCCGAGRSTRDLGVEGSLDGISYFSLGDFILSQPVGDPFLGETFALSGIARYVRFNLNSNYGDAYVGLSEVQFEGAAAPEPEVLGLLAIGLLGMGALRVRRH